MEYSWSLKTIKRDRLRNDTNVKIRKRILAIINTGIFVLKLICINFLINYISS